MSDHRCLVPADYGDAFHRVGDIVDHEGPPSWMLEPVDPVERTRWEAETAKPHRVERELATWWGYPETTAAMIAQHPAGRKLPPSGPNAGR